MNTPLTPFDDESAESDDQDSIATGTLDPTLDPSNAAIELAAHWNGPQCEKCNTPFKSDAVTICRRCGWYASLNQFVEVDQDWEAYSDDDQRPAEVAKPSHVEVWLNLLPRWAWIVIAVITVVVVESAIVRLVTPNGSSLRTTWSLTQMMIGLMAFLSCHVFTFLLAIADDSDTGVLDIILRPLKLWLRAFGELPKRQWVTDAAAAGLTAVLMSFVVIGGIPYERLWDWGFEKPVQQNLMGAVMSQMQKVEGDGGADNLEDAVTDFAGSQNLEPGDAGNTPPPKPREKTDCVILGYRLDAQGRLTSLVLGTAYRRNLVYAGAVSPNLAGDEEAELINALVAARSDQPFLAVQTSAIWVEPRFTCRISFVKRLESGALQDPQWEQLLGGIRLK